MVKAELVLDRSFDNRPSLGVSNLETKAILTANDNVLKDVLGLNVPSLSLTGGESLLFGYKIRVLGLNVASKHIYVLYRWTKDITGA